MNKLNLTINDVLKYIESYELDCDYNIAKEIYNKLFQKDFFSIIYLYGEDYLLVLLNMLEEMEEFEVCKIIINQIEEQNKINKDVKIRTRY